MKYQFCLLVGILFVFHQVSAMTADQDTFPPGWITIKYSYFRGTLFEKDGKTRPVGIFYRRLDREFDQMPDAKAMFIKAKRQRGWSGGLATTGLIFGGLYVVHALKAAFGVYNVKGIVTDQARIKNHIYLSGTFIGLTTSLIFQTQANRSLRRAVNMRNKQLTGF